MISRRRREEVRILLVNSNLETDGRIIIRTNKRAAKLTF